MTSAFADMVRQYQLPARDPTQRRPEVAHPPRWRATAGRIRGEARRRRRGRRLAYLDSMFPWERSGFRYHEAEVILDLLPDTLFFSLWELTDPFPATVHPLADFLHIAPAAGVTDAYAVFQLFLEGLCGLRPSGEAPPHTMEGPDLWRAMRAAGIRLHGGIYPGGGFVPTPEGLTRTRILASRLDTTFSYVPEVLREVPGVTPVDQAFTKTGFYVPTSERWERHEQLVCLFAADAPPRKGVDVALAAFRGLDESRFHLHVVGPHEHRRDELSHGQATFHGWLSASRLRDLHRRVHVFLSPVMREAPGPAGSFQGVVDGFPTQAAADAMSSGCLLLSANPAADRRVLAPGVHYVECEPDVALVRAALSQIATDLDRACRIARAGSDQVRSRMAVRSGVAAKLAHMGFPTGGGPLPTRPR
jgi:glycosyl transferase family 1